MEVFSCVNITIVTYIIILLFSLYIYCRYKVNYWKRKGVQQLSNTNVIFGDFKNGVLFRSPPGYHLGEIYRRAPSDARYIGFYIFHKPCLLLKDPEIIKQMFINNFNCFPNRHFGGLQQRDSLGMTNLFGINNPAWRYLRQKISPTLTKRHLKQMLPLMVDNGEPMLSYLKKHVDKYDKPMCLDAQDLNYKYTADLIANIALGTKTDSFSNPDSDYTKYLMSFFCSFKRMVALVTVFFMPELASIFGSLILFNSSFVRKMFWNSVKLREKSGHGRGDFIDSIIKMKNGPQNSIYRLEGDNLLFQSGTFFPGLESSSTASAFTLMELAKHKPYQDRAREEIRHALNKHGWTIDAVNNMKYLDQCIAESVRLHPAISTLDRYTVQDYNIPNTDIWIKKGTPIFISLNGLHTDAEYFDDPLLYNPERFANDRIVSDAYMPFGIGRRKCVGMKLGQLHVKVMISLILNEYGVYQPPHEENKLNPRSTFTVAINGLNMTFTKLSSKK